MSRSGYSMVIEEDMYVHVVDEDQSQTYTAPQYDKKCVKFTQGLDFS